METKNIHSVNTTPYVDEPQDASTGAIRKVAKSIKSNLSQMFSGRKFDKARVPAAYEAYLKSKYTTVQSNDARLDEFMSKVADAINSKNSNYEYALVREIPDDIVEYVDIITNYFTHKGYVTQELSKVVEGLSHRYLFIAFDNFRKAQDEYMKYNSGTNTEVKIEEN